MSVYFFKGLNIIFVGYLNLLYVFIKSDNLINKFGQYNLYL